MVRKTLANVYERQTLSDPSENEKRKHKKKEISLSVVAAQKNQ